MKMRPASALFATLLALAVPALARDGQAGAPPPRADAGTPWRVLQGDLTRADYERYTDVSFDLPAGVTRLTIYFSYGGKEQRSVIDLGLRDPERFRGWSGGTRDHMTLSTEDATPGYLPGPLPAGRWNLILGAPNISENAHAPYTAKIFIERAPSVTEFADAPIAAKPGWYRGDLHMHSGESDGKCKAQSGASIPCPVYRTVEAAAARGLDFIALSDHNTAAQFNQLRELQGAFDRMLLVPGREITTFWGHGNVFGPTDFLDFRMTGPNWEQARKWIDAVHREGGVVSINHPGAPSGAICMGCGWRVDGLPDGAVDSVEVVNGGTMRETGSADGRLQGLSYWAKLLNAGRHVTAVGGSDSHEADRPAREAGAVGSPTTVVYMPELSVHGLLAGIRSGRVFVDVDGTRDRLLDLSAVSGKRHAVMGETLHLPRGGSVRFAVDLKGVADGAVQLVIDGAADTAYRAAFGGGRSPTFAPWRADGRPHWISAQVRDAQGRLILIGNPIYVASAGPVSG
ncbi:CehA/McbA family metallohydrolase [Sphingomonas sp. H39-1-10]|uniref:CehA/McbA family metallohydrolase n=1 Tax=Sphingomonas pollutisoli TaxID=3030829 RepID=UPI0023B97508|nr:CehA/McbA family metallohydrolase [Sphingomonas pollutisoli]MDF0488081.1 CehA/McbA family metallohydrolase [Sphingomonas pollutisoli]